MSKRAFKTALALLSVFSASAAADVPPPVKPMYVTEPLFRCQPGDGCGPFTSTACTQTAQCNNTADDTCPLQNAINWAAFYSAKLLVPSGTCKFGSPASGPRALTVPGGSAIAIEGAVPAGVTPTGSGSQLFYTGPGGTAAAITVGDDSTFRTFWFALSNVVIYSETPNAILLELHSVLGGRISDVTFYGPSNGAPGSSANICLSFQNSFSILVQNVTIKGDFNKGFYCSGSGGCNGHVFSLFSIFHISDSLRSGTIGFHWADTVTSDGMIFGANVEHFAVGYQIDGYNLKGYVRSEDNTIGIVFSSSSQFNEINQTSFDPTTPFSLAGTANTINQLGVARVNAIRLQSSLTQGRVTPTYGATVAVNALLGNEFVVTPTNGADFTITNPTNPILGPGIDAVTAGGQRITIRVRNTFGAIGNVTWGNAYKMGAPAWTQPANTFSRAIDFQHDGVNWIEISRTPNDIPN